MISNFIPIFVRGGLVFAISIVLGGCATRVGAPSRSSASTDLSPLAQVVAPRDAWRLAETYVAAHPGSDIVIGRGNSMLPLYPDRTVLVLERVDMAALRCGMTVIFLSDDGRTVAHVLQEKKATGWVAQGLNNPDVDDTPIRVRNYVGTVVRAFTPDPASGDDPQLIALDAARRLSMASRSRQAGDLALGFEPGASQ